MLFREDLHEYQNRAVEFIKEKKRCMLFLEMGLGKSISTLTAIADLIDSFAVHKTLVIAPLRVANSVWKQEAAKWGQTQHMNVSICTGTERERLSALHVDADVYVINRENVVWLQKNYKKWPFDCVIIDESSSFKSPSSKRFRALKKVIPDTEYMVLLTGTPSPNGLLDLWSQVYLVDFGMSLGRTMTAYKKRFFEADYMGYKFTPRAGADDEIQELIRPFTLSMRSEDYLDLPDRIDLEECVDLSPKLLREYKEFERDLFIELEAGEEIEAMSAAVLANKLLQFCIAKGTKVVTSEGFVNIENITPEHDIWDGEKWVNCYGSISNGYKPVITCYGIKMTKEHLVLTETGWIEAGEVANGKPAERFERAYLRNADRITDDWIKRRKGYLAVPMRMRKRSRKAKSILEVKAPGYEQELRVYARQMELDAWYDELTPICDLAEYGQSLHKRKGQRLQKLWRKGYQGVLEMAGLFRKLLGGYGERLFGKSDTRSNQQRWRLYERKLSLGYREATIEQHAKCCDHQHSRWEDDCDTSCGKVWNKGDHTTCKNFPLQNASGKVVCEAKKEEVVEVYDLINCGPDNRFTVVDDCGKPLIVHNCNGALYTDEHGAWANIHNIKIDALKEIVEQNEGENILVAYNYKSDLDRLKKAFPDAVPLSKEAGVIDQWNDGQIPMLLAHPQSASHGLNLQRGGAMAVWFGLNWSLECYQQFNARLHRQGQDRPVRIVHIVASDTIDERVMRVLSDKAATQDALLNALRP